MRILPLAIAVAMLPAPALAELYISPAVRQTVTIDQSATQKAVTGESQRHGKFQIASQNDEDCGCDGSELSYGENVPLFVALEHIVPNSHEWKINIDSSVDEDMPVSWEGGQTWTEVLRTIEDDNNLAIAINNAKKAIGVAMDRQIAGALAHPEPRAWRTDSTKNLEENMRVWLESIGYTLVWHETIENISFPVVSDTVLMGSMFGTDGVLDRLMAMTARNTADRHLPLAARAYHGDRVVVVREAVFESKMNK